jgi:hypothetical protein
MLAKSVRQVLATAALCAAALGAAGSPAAAAPAQDPWRQISIYVDGDCDTATGEWVVSYTVHNEFNVAATLGNVQTIPADAPVTGLEGVLAPEETRVGVQRLPAKLNYANIYFAASWHDGETTGHPWRFAARTTCNKAA